MKRCQFIFLPLPIAGPVFAQPGPTLAFYVQGDEYHNLRLGTSGRLYRYDLTDNFLVMTDFSDGEVNACNNNYINTIYPDQNLA